LIKIIPEKRKKKKEIKLNFLKAIIHEKALKQ